MKNPKKFAATAKCGPVTINIYERRKTVAGKVYTDFSFGDYSTGKRRMRSFADLDEAKRDAQKTAEAILRGEVAVNHLDAKQKLSCVRALDILNPCGVPLDVAAAQYAFARQSLKNVPVSEAVNFYLARHTCVRKPVGEAVKEFIAAKKLCELSKRYIEDLENRCGRFARAFHCELGDLTSEQLKMYFATIKGQPRTHNNELNAISTFVAWAKNQKYLPKDWDDLTAVEKKKERLAETEIFTPQEMAALLKHASEDLLPVITIGGFAGVRSAEIARLEWRQLNFSSRTIEVLANGSKTGSRRLAPLTDNLAAWLTPYASRTGKIWPHSMAYLYEAIELTAQKATVHWKRNALRHSFVSFRLAVVANADQVALESGHSARMLFKHYRELVTEELGHQWFAIAPASGANVIVLSSSNVVAVEKFG